MGDIEDADYKHIKNVCQKFEIKNLGEYHDLYVQSDTLLLENFRNKCIEIYELDPAHSLLTPALSWQSCFKKSEIELELLTDIHRFLIVGKGIRGGICHAIHRHAAAKNKHIKIIIKTKNQRILCI